MGFEMATMEEVARAAGVSLSTVSYALSGARPVSVATKARIASAMSELNFQPNAMARGLASRRSQTLALTYPAIEQGLGGTAAEFVASAAARARALGYHFVLWPFGPHEADEISALAQQGMADGVLLMEVFLQDERVDALRAAGVPFAMIGRTEDTAGLTYVDIDFERTTEEAVAYLTALGHEHIGFLNHSEDSWQRGYAPTRWARESYRSAMTSRGLGPVDVLCHESPLAGRHAVVELLAADPAMTAVITMNEMATFGLMAELRDRGRRIPEDVSVLGIVTSPGVSQMSSPTLTTLHAPGAELGRRAVDSLVALLSGEEPELHAPLVPCRLEPGETTARAPRAAHH